NPERRGWFGFGQPAGRSHPSPALAAEPVAERVAVGQPLEPDELPVRRKRRSKRWDQPGRKGKARTHSFHDRELIKALKQTALDNDMTVQDLVDYGIRQAIIDHDGELPADELDDLAVQAQEIDPDPELAATS